MLLFGYLAGNSPFSELYKGYWNSRITPIHQTRCITFSIAHYGQPQHSSGHPYNNEHIRCMADRHRRNASHLIIAWAGSHVAYSLLARLLAYWAAVGMAVAIIPRVGMPLRPFLICEWLTADGTSINCHYRIHR